MTAVTTGNRGPRLRLRPRRARLTLATCAPTSACIAIKAGTTIKTKITPNPRPKTSVITVGLRNCACDEVSYSKGDRPRTVVNVVSNTGLNRSVTPSTIAGNRPRSLEYSSIVVTKTMESLIIIPTMPISPTTENSESGMSYHQWP